MKPKIKLAITGGLAALIFCLFLAWVGGFNFDHRGVDVAFACFLGPPVSEALSS